ncbi:hypothetical protein [Natronospora cellulosivora (SeqCode)]
MDKTRVYLTEGLSTNKKKKRKENEKEKEKSLKASLFLNVITVLMFITSISISIYFYINSVIDLITATLIALVSINFGLFIFSLAYIIKLLAKINKKINYNS